MSLEDKPNVNVIDEAVAQAIRKYLDDDKLPCATAFTIAKAQEIKPSLVGHTADALRIKLSRCQLGLFGYPGKTGWDLPNLVSNRPITEHPIPEGLETAIRDAATAPSDEATEHQLTCAKAWNLAARFNTPRMLVGYLADQLGVRIVACQLGAF